MRKLTWEQIKPIREALDVLSQLQETLLGEAKTNPSQRAAVFAELGEFMSVHDSLNDLYVQLKPEGEPPVPEEKFEEMLEDYLPKDAKSTKIVGTLERKLVGGQLNMANGRCAFVPEAAIQAIGAENGDTLEGVPNGVTRDQNNIRYIYSVIEKNPQPTPRREAVVSVEDNGTGRPFSMTDHGRINLIPAEVERFNVEQGDVITIAYWSDNLNQYARIMFKHSEEGPMAGQLRTLITRKKTEREPKPPTEQVLQGYRICVFGGGDSQEGNYRDALTELGADFEFITGDESEEMITGAIRRSDLLVYVWKSMSHPASGKVRDILNFYKVPFEYAPSTGVSGVIRTAVELVENIKALREA